MFAIGVLVCGSVALGRLGILGAPWPCGATSKFNKCDNANSQPMPLAGLETVATASHVALLSVRLPTGCCVLLQAAATCCAGSCPAGVAPASSAAHDGLGSTHYPLWPEGAVWAQCCLLVCMHACVHRFLMLWLLLHTSCTCTAMDRLAGHGMLVARAT